MPGHHVIFVVNHSQQPSGNRLAVWGRLSLLTRLGPPSTWALRARLWRGTSDSRKVAPEHFRRHDVNVT